MSDKIKGMGAILMATCIWGGGFVALSKALETVDTLGLLAVRFLLAALFMGLIFFKNIKTLQLTEIKRGIPSGICLFMGFLTQSYALKLTTVANNAFLSALNVIFTPYFLWLIYRIKPGKKLFLASLMALMAVGFLTLHSAHLSVNLGTLFSLIDAVFFSLHLIFSSRMKGVSVQKITFIQFTVTGLLGLFGCLFFGGTIAFQTPAELFLLAYLTLFSTVLCYVLQIYGLKRLPTSLAAIILTSEAMFATLFASIFLKQALTLDMGISMILLVSAVSLATGREKN